MKNIKNMAEVKTVAVCLYVIVKTTEGIKEVVINSGLSRTLSIQYIKDNIGEIVFVKDVDSKEAKMLVKKEFFVTGEKPVVATKWFDPLCGRESIKIRDLNVSRKQELRLAFTDFNSYYPKKGVYLELPLWVVRKLLDNPDLGLVYGNVEICVIRSKSGKNLYYKYNRWYYIE